MAYEELIRGRRVIASVSGGKDSTAMMLHLREAGVEFTPVFMDTGWEHPEVYAYLGGLEEALGVAILRLESPGMPALVRKKGMFPWRLTRFCTTELKVAPLARFLKGIAEEPLNAVGIRAEESAARASLPDIEPWGAGDCDIWRPILRWGIADVVDIHRRHGIKPCPLYDRGVSRLGCWPCIFARKHEVALLGRISPERVDEIEALEAELSARAGTPRTFFRGGPIRDVVDWAATGRGGRQLLLEIDEPTECVRWGLCDVAKSDVAR